MPIPVNIPWKFIAGSVGILAAIAALVWLVNSRDSWRDHANASDAALATTVKNYRDAATQARKDDAANKVRVEAEQANINQRTANEYQVRIAAVRADYERLRAQAGTHPSGSPATSVSLVRPAPSGTPGPAAQDELSLDDRLLATEQAIQLDELIKAVVQHSAINVNGSNEHPTR